MIDYNFENPMVVNIPEPETISAWDEKKNNAYDEAVINAASEIEAVVDKYFDELELKGYIDINDFDYFFEKVIDRCY